MSVYVLRDIFPPFVNPCVEGLLKVCEYSRSQESPQQKVKCDKPGISIEVLEAIQRYTQWHIELVPVQPDSTIQGIIDILVHNANGTWEHGGAESTREPPINNVRADMTAGLYVRTLARSQVMRQSTALMYMTPTFVLKKEHQHSQGSGPTLDKSVFNQFIITMMLCQFATIVMSCFSQFARFLIIRMPAIKQSVLHILMLMIILFGFISMVISLKALSKAYILMSMLYTYGIPVRSVEQVMAGLSSGSFAYLTNDNSSAFLDEVRSCVC